jgi:hypothetical protein
MVKILIGALSIGLMLISCGVQHNVVEETRDLEPICSGYTGRDNLRVEDTRRYLPIYTVELALVVKDGDTLGLSELPCVDSVNFTRVIQDTRINEICVELGIQGRTFFSATTNKYGGFENVKVLRSVDRCFRDIEEKIINKVLRLRVIPEMAGTYEVLFFYLVRLE